MKTDHNSPLAFGSGELKKTLLNCHRQKESVPHPEQSLQEDMISGRT